MKKIYTLAALASFTAATAFGQQPLKPEALNKEKVASDVITAFDGELTVKAPKTIKNSHFKSGENLTVIWESDVAPTDWTTFPEDSVLGVFEVADIDSVGPTNNGQGIVERFFSLIHFDDTADLWGPEYGTSISIDSYFEFIGSGGAYESIKTQAIYNDPIDISGSNGNLALLFEQLYTKFNYDITSFMIRADTNSPWNVVPIPDNQREVTPVNDPAPRNINFVITDLVPPGATEIYIGFDLDAPNNAPDYEFGGSYGWAIDNVKIVEIPEADVTIGDMFYGGVNNDFAYGTTPIAQVRTETSVGAEVGNVGALTQTVNVTFTIKNGSGATVSTKTTADVTLDPDSAFLFTDVITSPTAIGSYTIEAVANIVGETDAIPADNTNSSSFVYSSHTYSGHADWKDGTLDGGFRDSQEAGLKVGIIYDFASAAQVHGFNFNINEMAQGWGLGDPIDSLPDEMIINVSFFEVLGKSTLDDEYLSLNPSDNETVEVRTSFDMLVTDDNYNQNYYFDFVSMAGESPIDVEAGKLYVIILTFEANNNLWIDLYNGIGDQKAVFYDGDLAVAPNMTEENLFTYNNAPLIPIYTQNVTSVDEAATADAKAFDLGQNRPNPFNGTTTINYSLENNADVVFTVHDITGKEVYSENSAKVAGKHSVELNASELNSGIYYYTLSVNGEKTTKKMIVTK